MPQTTLMDHFLGKQGLFNTLFAVGEKGFKLRVMEAFGKMFAYRFPICVYPEPNRFKAVLRSLRSQGPSHFCKTHIFTPFTLQAHPGTIHNQEPKIPFSEVVKRLMILSKSFKPAMNGRMTHRILPNPVDFLGCPPVRHMGAKTYGWLQRFFKKMHMCWNRKSLGKRHETSRLLIIQKLRKTIRKTAKRTSHLPRFALAAVFLIPRRTFLNISLHFPYLYSFKHCRNDCLMDLRRTLFEPMNQTIDCKFRTWYLKHQAQVNCDLAQRIPPFFYMFSQTIKKRNPLNFARIIC